MTDTDQAEAVTEEVEEKGEALDDQFAAADAEAEVADPPSVEEVAKSIGWTPKDQFDGPEDKWKPADQFIKDGRKSQRKMRERLDQMTATLDTVAKTTGAVMAEKIAEARAQAAQEYASAVERGDPDAAWKAANKIQTIDSSSQPQAAAPMPETVEWAKRNAWMGKDPVATQYAIEVADMWARRGASAEVQTAKAEEAVRREFPHHFAQPERAAEVNGVRSRASGGQRKGNTAADMPKQAQAIADDLVDRGLIPDREAYARNYFAQAAKGK